MDVCIYLYVLLCVCLSVCVFMCLCGSQPKADVSGLLIPPTAEKSTKGKYNKIAHKQKYTNTETHSYRQTDTQRHL